MSETVPELDNKINPPSENIQHNNEHNIERKESSCLFDDIWDLSGGKAGSELKPHQKEVLDAFDISQDMNKTNKTNTTNTTDIRNPEKQHDQNWDALLGIHETYKQNAVRVDLVEDPVGLHEPDPAGPAHILQPGALGDGRPHAPRSARDSLHDGESKGLQYRVRQSH